MVKTCTVCKKSFKTYASRIKIGKGNFCSQRCWMDSPKRKAMMSKIHTGKKCPFAKPPRFEGEKHWNWQGGKTPANTKIRNSKRYKDWQRGCLARDNYTCQFCGLRGGRLHVDHIMAFAHFPHLRFEPSNGRTLCVPCHKTTDTYLSKSRWPK